ncbi:MAG: transposase [Bacteroidales bacterium]
MYIVSYRLQEPFKGPETVLEYLGRYTHKIAISNYRIKKITDTHVGFTYLDRNDGDKKKYLEIPGEKFIHRFLCHIVPYRFVRIRHYGFLSTRNKKECLRTARPSSGSAITPVVMRTATC